MGSFNTVRFPTGQLTLQQNGRTMTIPVEIADTPDLWKLGLMYRKDIAWQYGMFYIFHSIMRSGGFWTKNVNFPLDVAYIDTSNRIINIQTMPPCTDNCPTYPSPAPFFYAMETRAGFFQMFGFSEGCEVSYKYG